MTRDLSFQEREEKGFGIFQRTLKLFCRFLYQMMPILHGHKAATEIKLSKKKKKLLMRKEYATTQNHLII